MPERVPEVYETYDALTVDPEGDVVFLAAEPTPEAPGFSGYLVPYYVLSDRGTFFVPGSFKKTAREQVKRAPHLWAHNIWEVHPPIGRHTAADADDPKGFRITVAVNEGVGRGAEVMSALRFGSPMGLSAGFTTVRDRSGTEEDDKKLDRRTAPGYLKGVPINELRAVTEAHWIESSTVDFGAIGTAKPDTVHRAGAIPDLAALTAAVETGTLTQEQARQIEALVAAWTARAGAAPDPEHPTRADDALTDDDRRAALAILFRQAGIPTETICAA